MEKTCGSCVHWTMTGDPHIKQFLGPAGRCTKPVPAWVTYILGERDLDRLMHEEQSAAACSTYEERTSDAGQGK